MKDLRRKETFWECRKPKVPNDLISSGLNIHSWSSFDVWSTFYHFLILKHMLHSLKPWQKSIAEGRNGERESDLVFTSAILSRTARSINIPRLHRLFRSTRAGSSKRFPFVRSLAEKKSFRRDYATDTQAGLEEERVAGRWERGDYGEIGFALQSRWSVTMGHSASASTRALIRYELSNYMIIRGLRSRRDAPGGSLNSISRRFSRRNEFSPLSWRDSVPLRGCSAIKRGGQWRSYLKIRSRERIISHARIYRRGK